MRPIHVQDGVFRYPDGSEVALFGTNYLPMSWFQYQNMKAVGADFRAAIHNDVAAMKRMGVQVVRVHIFDREISDGQGHLIDNEHLQLFDVLVHELDQQGIYLFLTPLCWWNSPVERPDSFGAQVTKMGMVFQPQAVAAGERFIGELLNHRNPHTGRALKDEPVVAAMEILNEPWYFPWPAMADKAQDPEWHRGNATPTAVYERDYQTWKRLWGEWRTRHAVGETSTTYRQFQQEMVGGYYARMIRAVRATGAPQPIAIALFETNANPGVLAAIAASEAQAVTDGWYPGGFEFNEPKNLFAEAANYQLPEPVRRKAKMVYEFDIPGTYENVGMYPAMARRYRSMGAQICCQFQYDSEANAAFNTDWGVHYLNEFYTPAKAVAFRVASEAFSRVPRGATYPTPADRQVFGEFAVACDPHQALMASTDTLLYAQGLGDWTPLPLPKQPRLIVGRGDSPLVQYDGSGFYRLEQSGPDTWALAVSPDVAHGTIDKAFFDAVSLAKPVVTLQTATPRTLRLALPGWGSFTCRSAAGASTPAQDGRITVTPGQHYTLTR